MKQALILINNYYSVNEVNSFILQLNTLDKKEEIKVTIIINDNTGEFKLHEDLNLINIYIVTAHKNLGYVGGCANGFNYWTDTLKQPLPDWTMIANTDLKLPSNFYKIFDHQRKENNVGILSPQVEDSNGNIQNPHIIKRVDKKHIQKYINIFEYAVTGCIYLYLSKLKLRLSFSRKNVPCIPNNTIYAAHGSIFILTKSFFLKGGSFIGCPFLYSEEVFFAEQAYILKLLSTYTPNIVVEHKAHASTGMLSINKKRKLMLQSYKKIYNFLYNDNI